MYRFFVDKNQISENRIIITGEDRNHIGNVLRMRPGEEISVVVPGSEDEYRCAISEYTPDEVICDLLFVKRSDCELPCKIILCQGLPKSDKMELIIQKAVELGVTQIVPVATSRAVVKLDKGKEDKKITRWNGISEAAAKQSKRSIIPEVTNVMNMQQALNYINDAEVKLIPYELSDPDSMNVTREIIGSVKPGDKVAVFIGPEGGFTEEEISEATQSGCKPVTLGRRILRTETAGMVVLSWLSLFLER